MYLQSALKGVAGLTVTNPTPTDSGHDNVYSNAPTDDPVSFATEGLIPAIECIHGKSSNTPPPPGSHSANKQ